MPKSRGRRKPVKKSPPRKRLPSPLPDGSPVAGLGRGGYDVGQVRSSWQEIGGLLLSGRAAPDLMVELLLPMLWLEHAVGRDTNLCVSACVSLHFAYAELGIEAHPRAVDLVVANQGTDQRTFYGRTEPYWTGSTFHGHCVLWLPGSKRFMDPTVEQYPEVRRHRLGPICGKIVAGLANTPDQHARIASGELIPGTSVGVERKDLLLLYTTVDHEYDDVVMSGQIVTDSLDEARRSGRNLAAQAIGMLRQPEVIDRARQTPHPRVRALLDMLADAEIDDDSDDELRFRVPGDDTPRRLDELARPPAMTPVKPTTATAAITSIPAPRAATEPPDSSVPGELDVVDDDRAPERRRGFLAWLRRSPAR